MWSQWSTVHGIDTTFPTHEIRLDNENIVKDAYIKMKQGKRISSLEVTIIQSECWRLSSDYSLPYPFRPSLVWSSVTMLLGRSKSARLPYPFFSRYYWEKATVDDYEKKAVFISGCDSGISTVIFTVLQYFCRIWPCSSYKMRQGWSNRVRRLSYQTGTVSSTSIDYSSLQGEESLQTDAKGLPLHTCPLDVTKDESVAEARKFVDKHLNKGISEYFSLFSNKPLRNACILALKSCLNTFISFPRLTGCESRKQWALENFPPS